MCSPPKPERPMGETATTGTPGSDGSAHQPPSMAHHTHGIPGRDRLQSVPPARFPHRSHPPPAASSFRGLSTWAATAQTSHHAAAHVEKPSGHFRPFWCSAAHEAVPNGKRTSGGSRISRSLGRAAYPDGAAAEAVEDALKVDSRNAPRASAAGFSWGMRARPASIRSRQAP
jgi:hypothetical protein